MKNIIKKPKNVMNTNGDNLHNFKPKEFVILLSKKNVEDYLKQQLKTATIDNELSLKTVLCSPPNLRYSKRLSMRSKPNPESGKQKQSTSISLKSNKQGNLLKETIEIASKTHNRDRYIKDKINEASLKAASSSTGIEPSETNLLQGRSTRDHNNEQIQNITEGVENDQQKHLNTSSQTKNIKEILGNRVCYIPLKRVNLSNLSVIESETILKVNAKKQSNCLLPSSEINRDNVIPQPNDVTQLSQRISKRRHNLILKTDSSGNEQQKNEKLKESTNKVLETEKQNNSLKPISNNNNEISTVYNPVCSSLNSSLVLETTPPEKELENKSREQNINLTAKRTLFFTSNHTLKNAPDICTNTLKPLTANCDNNSETCPENVYDFLSQPSSPEIDPAADIIEKLISAGRAKVIKYRSKVKRLQTQSTKLKKKQKNTTGVSKKNTKKENVNKLDKEQILNATGTNIDTQKNLNEQNSNKNHFDNDSVLINKNGRFSYLAQSIMKKQAKRMKLPQMVTDRKKLLKVANKFVSHSTPNNFVKRKKILPDYSPVLVLKNNSPWRCENASLPNIFNFTLNSNNLPSHSSDVIPCSQNNNITTNTSQLNDTIVENVQMTPLNVAQLNDSNMENIQTPKLRISKNTTTNTSQLNDTMVENVQISLSNVSQLNDSNMENIQPPKSRTKINQNEMYRLSLNPKHPLSLRSPLKPINIINMVQLPTLTHSEISKIQGKENSLNDTTEQSDLQTSVCTSPAKTNDILKKNDEKDPFGFNEIITEEDEPYLGQKINHLPCLNTSKKHLKSFLPKTKPTRCSYEAIKPIFKVTDGCKSRNIKEMLTSTRIEHQNAEADNNVDNSDASDNLSVTPSLFRDYDPETTFDTKSSRRTYSRIIQKKRKLRHNFVLFLDSDESGSEIDETKAECRTTHRTKKKNKIEKEQNPQLNQFIEQFNSMCDEVEQFPLVIE